MKVFIKMVVMIVRQSFDLSFCKEMLLLRFLTFIIIIIEPVIYLAPLFMILWAWIARVMLFSKLY